MSMTGRHWTRAMAATLASIVVVTLLFAWFAWRRRWISDDGLIFVRIVEQILAGNGPVYNAFERAEANTSALWPWLLALLGALTRAGSAHLAVGLGIVSSVAGLALALDGTRRWQRQRGATGILVPCSVMVPLAVFSFWDYASSGLETGLTTLWLAASWWLLVTLDAESSRRRQLVVTVVFGLGPLVRPDLGIASVVFLVAAWSIVKPPRRRALGLAAAAIALPLAYEIFRAGYYGVLVPLPALAKGASASDWERGVAYLVDFVGPFWLWIPFAAFATLFGFAIARRSITRRDRILIAAPIASALLMGFYVVKVGGDFMHGRMWLPATFLALLPGLLVPLRRITAPVVVVVATWAAVMMWHAVNDPKRRATSGWVEDERVGYVWWTGSKHPVSESVFIRAAEPVSQLVRDAVRERRRTFISEGGGVYALDPRVPASLVFVAGRLGTAGMIAPLDAIVPDTLGLANPIGARIPVTSPDESAGHQKVLPWPWLLADFSDPAHFDETGFPPVVIRAAANAMQCGELKELLASARAPMSASRFFANLRGSVRRTRLSIPADPVAAELKFCGSSSVPTVTASSSCEDWGWSKAHAIDGRRRSTTTALGYSSAVWVKENHPEWIEIRLPAPRSLSNVVLYPRTDPDHLGHGFPIDFSIQIWNGATWVPRVERTDFPTPTTPQTFSLGEPVVTDRLRVHATKLQLVPGDDYVLQLAEVEAL